MHKFSIHLSILFVGIYSTLLFAQHDLKIEYSLMKITTAKVGGVTRTPTFYRHNAVLELGLGQATFGVVYQHAAKDKKTVPGKVENGVMLTAGYDLILSSTFRLEAFGRLGITSGNDPAQPLYATDTDLRLNLVTFTRDGGKSPSAGKSASKVKRAKGRPSGLPRCSKNNPKRTASSRSKIST